ncbi:MAG TPA: hypothetical protein VEU47_10935 [Candidatus Cybelea sp.]|nr:hypothetical protein [Candidatus Cybelea sp.]
MDPTAPGMPLNILPPAAQAAQAGMAPMGILNGQAPPNPQAANQQQLLAQAQRLMQSPQAPPGMQLQAPPQLQLPQQPIQMARPAGMQGIDPMKLLTAMKQNNLMNG